MFKNKQQVKENLVCCNYMKSVVSEISLVKLFKPNSSSFMLLAIKIIYFHFIWDIGTVKPKI